MRLNMKMKDCPDNRKPTGPIAAEELRSSTGNKIAGSGNARHDNDSRITGERKHIMEVTPD